MLKGKIVGANKISIMGADEVGDMALLASFARLCCAVCIPPTTTLSESNNNNFFAL